MPIALLALELLLQGAALVAWLAAARPARALPADPGRVVLCVGDSLTYGMGADAQEQCYPMQLERLLNAAGSGRWTVVNGGWPGHGSRDVRLALPAQLADYAPSLVYVMIGHNDSWNLPEPIAADLRGGFPLVWRTGRLVALIADALRPDERPAFVGTWHGDDGTELTFEPGGRVVSAREEMRWHQRDGELFFDAPGQGRVPVAWRRDGDALRLECALWTEPAEFRLGALPEELRGPEVGERLLRDGRVDEAERVFTRCLARPQHEVAARLGMVRVLAPRDRERALAHVERLRALAADGDAAATTALTRAHLALGDAASAMQLVDDQLRRDPAGFRCYDALASLSAQPERRDAIASALAAAVAATRDAPALSRLGLLRALYLFRREADPVGGLRLVMEAALLDRSSGLVIEHLQAFRGRIAREDFDGVVEAVTPDQEQRARLRSLWDRAQTARDYAATEEHLRAIVALCRGAGAEPVLVDYPSAAPAVHAVVGRVGAELGAGVLDLGVAFDRARRERPEDQLFAADGMHCNGAGYAVIARAVGADALAR